MVHVSIGRPLSLCALFPGSQQASPEDRAWWLDVPRNYDDDLAGLHSP